jgi:hypothetical protein
MFCPKCATQNIEGAHYCRSCGANLSLIPHALAGQLPAAAPEEDFSRRFRRRYRNPHPTLDDGIRNIVMGFGFVAVALSLALFGRSIGAQVWWFWMLIPAFGMLGRGIAEVVRANQAKSSAPPVQPTQLPYSAPRDNLPSTNTSELQPSVPSVTEGTTRHLGSEVPARRVEAWDDQKPS